MYTTRSSTSSSQQERIRKMRPKGFDIKKVNGQMGKLEINIPSRHVENNTALGGIVSKKRKFGRDAKNVVEIMDQNSEKGSDDIPIVYDTPANTKRSLRTFSNENSRFVKNVPSKKTSEMQMNTPKSGKQSSSIVKHEPLNNSFCSSMPTSSTNNGSLANCSSALPSRKFSGVSERNERTVELEPWVKRKFYVVENAGRPTEVYCTDFIHKVKQEKPSRYQAYSENPRSLLKITDKWREEWSANGVQMPLGNIRDQYEFEATEMFPELPEAKLFEPPKKLISLYPTKYTKEYATDFQQFPRQPLFYYCKDLADDEWLESEANQGHKISTKTFVGIMNLLELTVYRKIHDTLLDSVRTFRGTGTAEEDAECMICQLPEWEQGDNIVFCDGCNIAVHQSCYGITSLPVNEWFCQLCTHFGATNKHHQSCLFCPVKGGPMKPTKHKQNWAHVACALWLPEVRFGDIETREPIMHTNDVSPSKWQAKCSICATSKGACIECIDIKCSTTFHVGCAISAGDFLLIIENDDKANNGIRMVSLCDKHAGSHRDKKVHRINKKKLPDMMKNFTGFVDCHQISKQLGIPLDIVERVHSYWISKRSLKKCQPLIPEPEANDISSPPSPVQKQPESSKHRATTSRQKTLAAASLIYDPIPKEKLLQNYEAIRMLRLDSEKARNLCYMIKQREKLKKAKLESLEEQVQMTANILFCEQPIIPMSKRRLDKLLTEWKESV